MKKTLLTGLFLGLPSIAFAQAAPDAGKAPETKPAPAKPAEAAKPAPAKPAEAAKPAAKPAEAAKPAAAKPVEPPKTEPAKPAEAPKPAETHKPETKPAETHKPGAKPEEQPSAAGPAGPGAATDAQASGSASLSATAETSPAASAAVVAEAPLAAAGSQPPVVARRSQMSWEEAEAQWKFTYHGYLRAPMRIGIGKRLPEDMNGYRISGQTDTTIHEATVPDDQYLSFQSTAHNMRSWAEGFFGFGNGTATGVLGIGSYNLTEGGFNDFRANWGITQAYVLLTPDLGYENVRIWAKAGAIVDRYGMAGRYDAGEYDTYMFGRTHVVGETFHVDYDINDLWTLSLEQGLGSHKPDPNSYNNARFTMLHHEHVSLKQGRDLEFGAHYLMSWSQEEYRPTSSPGQAAADTEGASSLDGATRNGLPNGQLWVAGLEARAELGAFGYIYGAYSHVQANHALTVSRAIEVLHSSGGGEFDLGIPANYLDSPLCHSTPPTDPQAIPGSAPEHWTAIDFDGCSDGNGYVNALQAQYEFSLTNFQQQISGGSRFWGHGFDTILKLYGLVAFAHSDARDTTQLPRGPVALGRTSSSFPSIPNQYSVTKSKFGADLTVQVLPWLSPALRFDRLMPSNHFSEQGFSILSPRLVFKTAWVTHEKITLGYSRYIYDQRICEPRVWDATNNSGTEVDTANDVLAGQRCVQSPPSAVPYDGFGTVTGKQEPTTRATGVQRPDENVFKIEATMWW